MDGKGTERGVEGGRGCWSGSVRCSSMRKAEQYNEKNNKRECQITHKAWISKGIYQGRHTHTHTHIYTLRKGQRCSIRGRCNLNLWHKWQLWSTSKQLKKGTGVCVWLCLCVWVCVCGKLNLLDRHVCCIVVMPPKTAAAYLNGFPSATGMCFIQKLLI